ncbi:MAG: TetR-like C-terminal domain-containing protein [Mycobacteriales bacterium]|nr:MAG: TetR family transcriptional regulator [Pseudonocardiales bacterium]
MPRAGLSPHAVVVAAADVADEVGYANLTLAAVAKRFGVALPSLYKHVDGLPGLRRMLTAQVARELAAELAVATKGPPQRALRALARTYRRYAHEHPGRYPALVSAPDPDDVDSLAASEAALEPILRVLGEYGIRGDVAIDAARTLRSALHGFVSLELGGGFGLPRSVDRSFDRLVAALDAAFRAWDTTTARAGRR